MTHSPKFSNLVFRHALLRRWCYRFKSITGYHKTYRRHWTLKKRNNSCSPFHCCRLVAYVWFWEKTMNCLFNINVCRVCMQNEKGADLLSNKDLLEKFSYATHLTVCIKYIFKRLVLLQHRFDCGTILFVVVE